MEERNVCNRFVKFVFGLIITDREKQIHDQLKSIDTTLVKLYADESERSAKLSKIRQEYFRIKDTGVFMSQSGASKEATLQSMEANMQGNLRWLRTVREHIKFFLAVKHTLEHSLITSEMASEIAKLKGQLKSHANVQNVIENIDEVAEHAADVNEMNDAINLAVGNGWLSDSSIDTEQMMADFLKRDPTEIPPPVVDMEANLPTPPVITPVLKTKKSTVRFAVDAPL